jgi:hypothetical protein
MRRKFPLLAREESLDKRGIRSDSLAGCRGSGTAFVCSGLVPLDLTIAVLRRALRTLARFGDFVWMMFEDGGDFRR